MVKGIGIIGLGGYLPPPSVGPEVVPTLIEKGKLDEEHRGQPTAAAKLDTAQPTPPMVVDAYRALAADHGWSADVMVDFTFMMVDGSSVVIVAPVPTHMPEAGIAFLLSHGWRVAPHKTIHLHDIRFVYRNAHGMVELDLVPSRDELWLWLEKDGDRRCLGLKFGTELKAVTEKIVQMQAALCLDDYLRQYCELQGVCEVSLVAWEQFVGRELALPKTPTKTGAARDGVVGGSVPPVAPVPRPSVMSAVRDKLRKLLGN